MKIDTNIIEHSFKFNLGYLENLLEEYATDPDATKIIQGQIAELRYLAMNIASRIKLHHPRFDRDAFTGECGLPDGFAVYSPPSRLRYRAFLKK